MPPVSRVALVTGGSRGIGAAIAAGLARAGARVMVSGRDDDDLARVVEGITTKGGHAIATVADLTIPGDIERLVLETRFKLGPVDVLVNNAGMAESAPIGRTEDLLWDSHLWLNLTAPFRLCREVAPSMAERGWGRIVNIASNAGKIGVPYTAAYSASKAGLLGLTRALAAELGARGVTSNAVCPGWVDTDLAARAVNNIAGKTGRSPADIRKVLAARNPQKRFTLPDEVASTVVFLASDDAAAINGQAWNVDGGEVMAS